MSLYTNVRHDNHNVIVVHINMKNCSGSRLRRPIRHGSGSSKLSIDILKGSRIFWVENTRPIVVSQLPHRLRRIVYSISISEKTSEIAYTRHTISVFWAVSTRPVYLYSFSLDWRGMPLAKRDADRILRVTIIIYWKSLVTSYSTQSIPLFWTYFFFWGSSRLCSRSSTFRHAYHSTQYYLTFSKPPPLRRWYSTSFIPSS